MTTFSPVKIEETIGIFDRIKSEVAVQFPILSHTHLNVACDEAERRHEQTWRFLCHVGHRKNKLCCAWDFIGIPRRYKEGIIWHEFGHLIAEPKIVANPRPKHINKEIEKTANMAILECFGIKLTYDPKFHHLEYVVGRRNERSSFSQRNPMLALRKGIPYRHARLQ